MTMEIRICALDGCERPTPDAFVCTACTAKARRMLADLPSDMTELDVTLTRQSKTGRGGARGVGHEYALAYAWAASDDIWAIGNTVSTWARSVREERYPEPDDLQIGPVCELGAPPWLPDWTCAHSSCERLRDDLELAAKWRAVAERAITFAELCQWLRGQLDWMRHQPWADEAFSELLSIRQTVIRCIDTRGWRYIGECSAILQLVDLEVTAGSTLDHITLEPVIVEQQCGADLRLYAGARTIRCQRCGAEHDANDQAATALLALQNHHASASEISAALGESGRKLTPERIRKWASRRVRSDELDSRGKPIYRPRLIADRCRVSDRAVLYRLGDVVAILDASKTKVDVAA